MKVERASTEVSPMVVSAEISLVNILCEYFGVAIVYKMAVAFPYCVVIPDAEKEHCKVWNSYK